MDNTAVAGAPVSSQKPSGLKKFVDNVGVDIVCRLAIGVMFLLSGIGKMMDLGNSVKAVYNFQLIPWDWAITLVGYALPFVELACALFILLGVFTRLGCYCIGAMSIVFFFGKMIVVFVQGRSINCGCFGELMNTMAEVTIWLDIPMLILCLILIFSVNRYKPGIGMLLSEKMQKLLSPIW